MLRAAAVALLAAISVCGTAPRITPPPGREGQDLYEATAMVLESERHGPMLCLGGIAESLPPQCGDVPIANWNWDAVAGEERMSGTTWGEYRVVGAYDGEAFTVSEVGPPRRDDEPFDDDPIEAPCPDPEGGWPWPDPDRSSEEDLAAAQRAAQRESDFAGLWIDYLETANPDAPPDALQIILTAAFTGDLERHEAELRELWGGPLCTVEHPRSYRELSGIQRELSGEAANDMGLWVLTSSVNVVDNVVEIHVVELEQADRLALEERYGQGTVRASAALTPVSR